MELLQLLDLPRVYLSYPIRSLFIGAIRSHRAHRAEATAQKVGTLTLRALALVRNDTSAEGGGDGGPLLRPEETSSLKAVNETLVGVVAELFAALELGGATATEDEAWQQLLSALALDETEVEASPLLDEAGEPLLRVALRAQRARAASDVLVEAHFQELQVTFPPYLHLPIPAAPTFPPTNLPPITLAADHHPRGGSDSRRRGDRQGSARRAVRGLPTPTYP